MDNLNLLANIIAITAIIPLAAFIYYYGSEPVPGYKHLRRYSRRWKTTSIGKTLMYQKISWLVFLLFVMIGVLAPPYMLEPYVRILMYGSLVVLFWRVFLNLRKLQKSVPPEMDTAEAEEGKHSAAGSQTRETEVVVSIVTVEDSLKNKP